VVRRYWLLVVPAGFFLALVVPVREDCVLDVPWFMVDVLPLELAVWFAVVELDTDWSPLPTFTPGLMFAEAFTSVLLMPTLASTATLGSTFRLGFTLTRLPDDVVDEVEGVVLEDWLL